MNHLFQELARLQALVETLKARVEVLESAATQPRVSSLLSQVDAE